MPANGRRDLIRRLKVNHSDKQLCQSVRQNTYISFLTLVPSRSANQIISRVLWDPKLRRSAHKSTPPYPTLCREKPVQHISAGWSHFCRMITFILSTSRMLLSPVSIVCYRLLCFTCQLHALQTQVNMSEISTIPKRHLRQIYGIVGLFWRTRSGNIRCRFQATIRQFNLRGVGGWGGGRLTKYVFSITDM